MSSRERVPAELVERIRQMRTDGMTATRIAAVLTGEGIPTARGKSKWHPATVGSISRGPRPLVLRAQGQWFPKCFDTQRDYLMWKEASRTTHGYCNDCSTSYREEMTDKGRCHPVFETKKRPGRTPSPAARPCATRRSDDQC
jgi:hypothetical protein